MFKAKTFCIVASEAEIRVYTISTSNFKKSRSHLYFVSRAFITIHHLVLLQKSNESLKILLLSLVSVRFDFFFK